MGQGVLFKQRYSSRNKPATAVLNVKHLIYIATRKGVRENEGCGFGLWGRLPEMKTAENLNNLKTAQRIVMDASRQNHTLYRVVLSVDAETAAQHGLYDRAPWQKLVTEHIAVLEKEMTIDHSDLCWAASMHYVKGHPHVHMMYWDNSDKVREEFIPPQQFDIMAEKVRAEFGREIFREELRPLQEDGRRVSKEARLELQALCREANLEEALNLNNVSNEKLDELTAAFRDLALALPKTGSLDYDYIVTKVPQLTAFLDKVMGISDFQKLMQRYENLGRAESKLYGNGDAKVNFEIEKARKALYKAMGNGVISVLREELKKLQAQAPTEFSKLRAQVEASAKLLITASPEYRLLGNLFPKLHTPIHEVLKDADFQAAKRSAVHSLCDDLRIRSQVRGYIAAALKLPENNEKDPKEFRKEVYRDLNRVVDRIVMDKLQEDAGWKWQYEASVVTNTLLRLFATGSQSANQQRSRHDLLRSRKPQLSKTAQKEKRKQQEQESGWSFEP